MSRRLLWALVLASWTGAVAVFSASVPRIMRARVLAVLGLISCGFLLFIIATSNPFERLLPAAQCPRNAPRFRCPRYKGKTKVPNLDTQRQHFRVNPGGYAASSVVAATTRHMQLVVNAS